MTNDSTRFKLINFIADLSWALVRGLKGRDWRLGIRVGPVQGSTLVYNSYRARSHFSGYDTRSCYENQGSCNWFLSRVKVSPIIIMVLAVRLCHAVKICVADCFGCAVNLFMQSWLIPQTILDPWSTSLLRFVLVPQSCLGPILPS